MLARAQHCVTLSRDDRDRRSSIQARGTNLLCERDAVRRGHVDVEENCREFLSTKMCRGLVAADESKRFHLRRIQDFLDEFANDWVVVYNSTRLGMFYPLREAKRDSRGSWRSFKNWTASSRCDLAAVLAVQQVT